MKTGPAPSLYVKNAPPIRYIGTNSELPSRTIDSRPRPASAAPKIPIIVSEGSSHLSRCALLPHPSFFARIAGVLNSTPGTFGYSPWPFRDIVV